MLQRNSFNEESIAYLANIRSLTHLALGLSATPLTDVAMEHIGKIHSLEFLDLQHSMVTDSGMAHLAGLTNMEQLWIQGASGLEGRSITDESVNVFMGMKRLQRLTAFETQLTDAGIRRIAALPNLRRMEISSGAVSEQLATELKKDYPALTIWIRRIEPNK